jgi:large subunit ribosomal protein L29
MEMGMKVRDRKVALKALSLDGLLAKRIELKEEMMRLRFKKAAGQLEGGSAYKLARRDIARIETLITLAGK